MKSDLLVFLALIIFGLPGSGFGQFQNIQVNSNELNTCNEPGIAINPANPDNIVIGANNTYCFYSFDGGQNWEEEEMFSSMGVWGDPSLVFDSDGNLFFAHLSGEPPLSGNWADRIVIQKSVDGGMTWNDGTYTGLNRPKFEDKEWISVDLTNSVYHDNLYVAWTEFDTLFYGHPDYKSRILFSRSTNSGQTWSDPLNISDVEGDCLDDDNTTEGAIPAVGPDGEIYISWAGPEGIVFDRSFDGGLTFGDDIFVTEHIGGWGWGFEIPGIYGNGLPQTICDVSNSPYRGTIYILWADQRNGITNTDIFLIKSTDKGLTWSEVKKINEDASGRPQFFPWMSIDPVTGTMYIVYYDRRNTISTFTEVYVAKSTDGGDTFQNSLISETPFEATLEKFLGDYINIVAYNNKIYPVWTRSDLFGRSIMMAVIDNTSDVEEIDQPSDYRLNQNYPNPFNPITKIRYTIPQRSFVSLIVYDVLGNEVTILVEEEKSAGEYEGEFDGSELTSGIYFYQLKAGDPSIGSGQNFIETKKMILMK
jgi:hypothetical protein